MDEAAPPAPVRRLRYRFRWIALLFLLLVVLVLVLLAGLFGKTAAEIAAVVALGGFALTGVVLARRSKRPPVEDVGLWHVGAPSDAPHCAPPPGPTGGDSASCN